MDSVIDGVVGIVKGADEGVVGCNKLVYRIVILLKIPVDLCKGIFEHTHGGVTLNALGERVELAEQSFDNGLNILFVYALLDLVTGGLYDLDRNGIRLFVLVEVDGRAEHILFEEVVHIVCKIRLDDNGGIVFAGIEIIDRFVRIVKKYEAEMIIIFKLVNELIAYVDNITVVVHIVTVVTDNCNVDIAGFPVRIPESINIKPSVERRQKQYRQNNKKGEEMPRQSLQVMFENS